MFKSIFPKFYFCDDFSRILSQVMLASEKELPPSSVFCKCLYVIGVYFRLIKQISEIIWAQIFLLRKIWITNSTSLPVLLFNNKPMANIPMSSLHGQNLVTCLAPANQGKGGSVMIGLSQDLSLNQDKDTFSEGWNLVTVLSVKKQGIKLFRQTKVCYRMS